MKEKSIRQSVHIVTIVDERRRHSMYIAREQGDPRSGGVALSYRV